MIWYYDFEVFKHDWLVVFINPYEQYEKVIVNDTKALKDFYYKHKHEIWVGYNSREYDQYILKAILCGFDPYEMNDWIINKKRKGYEFSQVLFKIPVINYDVMPSDRKSLKTLEAFMGKAIHETSVPFDIDRKLTPKEIEETITYCRYDVENTIEVFLRRKSEFNAQIKLLKIFDLPLKYVSKTQAQLAAIILGAKKQSYKDEWNIRIPDNVILGKYQFVADWFLDKNNHYFEKELPNKRGKLVKHKSHLDCTICGKPHVIAWGGIHGSVSKTIVTCAEDELLFDVDAGQLYPNIMLHYKLLSRNASKPEMLDFVLGESMRLKALGLKEEREPFKRQNNIFYGAEGDKTNALYDPLHRTLVCVYGQLFTIDLLEKLEDIIELVNTNTDGVFFKVKKRDLEEMNRRIAAWEERTKLKMEFVEFSKMYIKDVNNYVGIKANGEIHAKGSYTKDLNDLDYDLPIINRALKEYMINNVPVEHTINCCNELREFQKVFKLSAKYGFITHNGRKVKENCNRVFASLNDSDTYLGKCRYEGATNEKFALSPDHCFIVNDDIRGVTVDNYPLDKQWYIDLAKQRLRDYGFMI